MTSLATSSSDAIDKVNAFVAAFNAGPQHRPGRGPGHRRAQQQRRPRSPAVSTTRCRTQLRDAFNAYVDAARAVANAIGTHAPTAEFNKRVDQLNDTKTKALKLCVAAF